MIPITKAAVMLAVIPERGRNLAMPGNPHYQPADLRPYLGYDAQAGWLVLAEWYYLEALAQTGKMPPAVAELMTEDLLERLLRITMTEVTKLERAKLKHDILALLAKMRKILPHELHPYLHLGRTSYDIICTAYALQARWTFMYVFVRKADEVSELWLRQISANLDVVHAGRTHLQHALPTTVGRWLAVLHNRFQKNLQKATASANELTGKFSGAVGTDAAAYALDLPRNLESMTLEMLGLAPPLPSTQITQPEELARFYLDLTLLSATLANLGDDVRHLQMTEVGEVHSASSTSSAMSHKTSNPVAAEQLEGMYVSVRHEYAKVLDTMNSTLERVLVQSSVMRGYTAIMVYAYQQLLTAERIFKSFAVDENSCRKNFNADANLVVAELLHLSLQLKGIPDAHAFVNKKIVPRARKTGKNLAETMDGYVRHSRGRIRQAWAVVPPQVKQMLATPEDYTGNAYLVATQEVESGRFRFR